MSQKMMRAEKQQNCRKALSGEDNVGYFRYSPAREPRSSRELVRLVQRVTFRGFRPAVLRAVRAVRH